MLLLNWKTTYACRSSSALYLIA